MPVQSIFGTEDKLTFDAMKLPGSFMHLFNVLPERFGIEVNFSTAFAGLFQWFLFGVYSILVLDEAVVRFKSFGAMPAKEWQGIMSFATMRDYFFGTNSFGTAIGTIVDTVLRIAME